MSKNNITRKDRIEHADNSVSHPTDTEANLTSLYMQTPPPLFSFSRKTQKLDWNAIANVDVDNDLLLNKDINMLETLLGNITMSELSKADLKMLKDKNLIKVFKLGQLATEYLMYQEQYMDSMCT